MFDKKQQALTEALIEKWSGVLDHENMPKIDDPYRRAVTAQLLENQQKQLREDAPVNQMGYSNSSGEGNIGMFDPILIAMVRRAAPQLIAYDVCGVQPMNGPTGLIFALKSAYKTQDGTEALFNEANTAFSGTYGGGAVEGLWSNTVGNANFAGIGGANATTDGFGFGTGMDTYGSEQLGFGDANNYAQMGFSIDKVTVTAQTRALKAEYTTELAQDLNAVHGLDAETELANILSNEILAEINREVVRTIYLNARRGCRTGTTNAYEFNLDVDASGRWSAEKFKGLHFRIEQEANIINRTTRRGKGNMVICSSDVASALQMAGVLDYSPSMQNDMNIDPSESTFAGTLSNRMRVYVDPYYSNNSGYEYAVVGYRGSNPMDAGIFYCPYVPLQMVRATGENTFQPKIAFKTRYGMAVNPFISSSGTVTADENYYYRRFMISNLL